MKNSLLLLSTLMMMSILVNAQENDSSSYKFSLLRQYDKVEFPKNKENKTSYDEIKYIPIFNDGYLSFGGSYRTQYEYFDNEGFIDDATDGWWLNRILLHSKFQINQNSFLFGEMVSSSILSKDNPSPVDKDELALNQLFFSHTFNNFNLILGRVNPTFGANRIISLREGPNVRRYFDGVKLGYNSKKIRSQGFYYQPVNSEPFAFDNDALDGDEYLYGIYNTISFDESSQNLDVYYIGRHIDRFTYAVGSGSEDRHSLGLRYFGNFKNLTLDAEGLYQFGTFENLDISAWTMSLKANYSLQGRPNEIFDFGLKTEYISGDDDPNDNKLTTFNALYPRGAYFGRVAQFGPMNLIDVHPSFKYSINKWFFFLDYVAFWRASDKDGIYGASLTLDFESVNSERFIGHQFGGVINYELNKFLVFEIEANYIKAGNFLENSPTNSNLLHVVTTIEFKF